MSMQQMQEPEFRKRVQEVLDQVEKALADVDPDVIECEQAFGALTLTLSDKSRCIISTQPSVRQIWLALAARGIAYHFNFDSERQQWWDDKQQGIELVSFLEKYLGEAARLSIRIR